MAPTLKLCFLNQPLSGSLTPSSLSFSNLWAPLLNIKNQHIFTSIDTAAFPSTRAFFLPRYIRSIVVANVSVCSIKICSVNSVMKIIFVNVGASLSDKGPFEWIDGIDRLKTFSLNVTNSLSMKRWRSQKMRGSRFSISINFVFVIVLLRKHWKCKTSN